MPLFKANKLLLLLLPVATVLSYYYLLAGEIIFHNHNNNTIGGITLLKSDTSTPKQLNVVQQYALKCLGKKNTTIITYPSYYDHFLELQKILEPYSMKHIQPHKAPGYHGPWLENHWQKWVMDKQHAKDKHYFNTLFAPYTPLTTAWTDVWVRHGGQYPKELLEKLQSKLRNDTLYITVVQNDDGFPGNDAGFTKLMRDKNILVLSSGGYGHVAVPLLKQREHVGRKKKKAVQDRNHLVSYTGSLQHAPNNLRQEMIEIIGEDHYYYGKSWRKVMRDSKFQLCPRGFGRTSYHIMEALQMGLIPVQVYLDMPWMPYSNEVMGNISFTTDLQGLPGLIDHLSTIPDAKIEAMEARIEQMIPDYFTYEGVLKQIQHFMLAPQTAALQCQPLPKHAGTKRGKYWQ